MALLRVDNLTVIDRRTDQPIIEDISFQLGRGQCLGIVGESGSGKSMTVKALLGLVSPWLNVRGAVTFDGEDLLQLKRKALRKVRGKRISMVLQDAMSAFNPLYTIGRQMGETIREHLKVSKREAEAIAIKELDKMGIRSPAIVVQKYPHELSGGMLQRCMIAIALAVQPDIIIADEPTTALDTINQKEVIKTFQYVREKLGIAVIFISHDLGVVQELAQSVLVMKDGRQVEYGQIHAIFHHPKQAYTSYLVKTRIKLTAPFTDAIGREINK